MSICSKPSVSGPDQPVETGKTEDEAEGPRPPDPACYIQIDVSAGVGLARSGQQSYVALDFIARHAERFRGPIGLERIDCKSPAT
jgi:hypothetical protein